MRAIGLLNTVVCGHRAFMETKWSNYLASLPKGRRLAQGTTKLLAGLLHFIKKWVPP
jgi:hypothetical protein